MELKEGSLDAQIAQGPLSPDVVRSIVRQVLAALARLHQDNRIHGAIRPGNLHIDAQGKVELGEPAAVLPGRAAGVSAPVGGDPPAPAKYLAPELLKPEFGAVGPGVDLYCLGFTAMELLKGPAFDALFPGVSPNDIDVEIAWLRWHSSPGEALAPAAGLIPGLPEDLGVFLDRLLKKNVQERYASAQAALHDLEEVPALTGDTIQRRETAKDTFAEDSAALRPQAGWQAALQRGGVRDKPIPAIPSAGIGWLSKKRVLLALLAIVLVPALLFFFWPYPSDKIAVTIASVPSHAKAFIDNQPLKNATDSTIDLAPGEYTLRLELDNYEPFEGKIGIDDHKRIHKVTLNKRVPLNEAVVPKPEKRTITLATDPPGADVYINGKHQDKKTNDDFEVDDGPVLVKLVYKGLPEVKIDDAGTLAKPVKVVFDRMVALRSDPPGATFFVDGKEIKSPATVPLQPGKYKVKAVMAAYAPGEKTLDVVELFQEERLTLRPLPVERHALIIGVRQGMKNLPSFVHAESDVESLGRALQLGRFKPDKVSVLTQTRGLINAGELPSAANIKKRLQDLVAKTTSADILVVALVGHAVDFPGVTYFVADGASQADPGTLVSLSDVVDALRRAPAPKKLLILDCWRKDWTNKDTLAHVRTWDEKPPPGVAILYGCTVGQTGYEHPESWYGAFNLFVSQGLLGEETGPQVTAPALAEFCQRRFSKLAADTAGGVDEVPALAMGEGSQAWAITSPGTATADYLLGCSHLENKEFDKALEAFNRAEPNLLSFPELYLRRADAFYNKRQYEAALADCGTALNLDSNNAAAYAHLADVQRAAARKDGKTDPKDYAEALKNVNKAMELDPACAMAYDARGTIYYSYNAFKAALKDYSEATRLQPGVWLAWGNLGLAHAALKQWDGAIAGFDKAIALDKSNPNLFVQRAIASSMNGNPNQAVEDFSTAMSKLAGKKVSLKSPYKEPWYNLGNAYFIQKMYARAKEALSQAVKYDAKYVEAYRLLIAVCMEMNDENGAAMYKKILDKLMK